MTSSGNNYNKLQNLYVLKGKKAPIEKKKNPHPNSQTYRSEAKVAKKLSRRISLSFLYIGQSQMIVFLMK